MRDVPLRRASSLGLLLGVLLSFSVTPGSAAVFNTGEQDSNYRTQRQIRYSFSVSNPTSRLMETGELWVYAPVRQTSTQRCLRVETSHPCELSVDDLGNQVLHFRLGAIHPFGTKVISIRADLAVSEVLQPQAIEGIEVFLRPAPFIESEHPEIVKAARQQGGRTPTETAQSTLLRVADGVLYTGYQSERRGALYALLQGKGDCTEFMDLFVAMCRASMIPARGVAGFVSAGNAALKPANYHNWAEFYVEGLWQTADPQNGVFMREQSAYVAMRILGGSKEDSSDESRLYRVSEGGLRVAMN